MAGYLLQILLLSAAALPGDRVTAIVRYNREAGYSLEEEQQKILNVAASTRGKRALLLQSALL